MLAVGIGATTAMFSVANGVLLAPLPYSNEKRLVAIVNHGTRPGDVISMPDVIDLRRGMKSFDEIGIVYASPGILTGDGDPMSVGSGAVSANWFEALGIRPELGRFFAPGDDDAAAPEIVVIGDELWRTRFGADRNVLGRTITIDGTARSVIGVAPAGMALPYKLGAWIPVSLTPEAVSPERRGNRYYQAVARTADDVSFATARAEFRTFTSRLHQLYPEKETGLDFDLAPLRQHVVGDARPALLVMLSAVTFVLLIACANVAGLLLLRARQRSAEMGIRLALGATPARVIREMLAESLAYGVLGGMLGVGLAALAVRGIVATRPGIPFVDNISLDWRVLTFAVAVTIVTAVIFGIAPAILASNSDLITALKSGSRSTSSGKRSSTLRQTFVVLELALALVLLVGAGLLGKSFERLMSVDTGFRPEGLVRFDIGVPSETFVRTFLQELGAMPGTRQVAAGFGAPFTGAAVNQTGVHIEGDPPDAPDHPALALWKAVTPGYLETLGVSIVRGRYLTAQDWERAPPVVIVNSAFVNAYLDGKDPIGKVVTNRGAIVGIVRDTKNQSLTDAPYPMIYSAFGEDSPGYLTVVIRSSLAPSAVIAAARKRLATIDKNIPIFDPGTYDDFIRATASRSQRSWELVAGFSAFALLLAAAGIYSVVAFAVRERRREFGIRMAIGAQQRDIVRLVLVQSVRLAALGVAIGLIVALSASSALRSMLYGVEATDSTIYAAGCAVLVMAALAASCVPAWSASRTDPTVVMRAE